MRVGSADEISNSLMDLDVVGPLGHAKDYGACYKWASVAAERRSRRGARIARSSGRPSQAQDRRLRR